MYLSSVDVAGFRSVASAKLAECGALNVLIGKNNSGKSNLLSAIQLFFDFLKSQSLVASAKPPIAAATDWFERETGNPIVITVTLELTDAEMQDVHNAISREAPQMRNALDEISTINTLECQLTFYHEPRLIGFISRIAFRTQNNDSAHTVFGLEKNAASEIARHDQDSRELRSLLMGIERTAGRFDADDWVVLRDRGTSARLGSGRPRFPDLPDEVNSTVLGMVRSSESYEEFRDRLSGYASELRGRISALLTTETEAKFETFSGESTTVPKYVTTIVELIAALRVHSLSEQRTPIGPDEASRILRLKTSRGQSHVLKDIQDNVSELLGVEIDAFSSDRQPARASAMAAELDVDDFLVQVNGSGIREALRLILDYEFERPEILMVEEPEVHLHPALEIAIMQYLRRISASCQVFLTTHSTNFLDIADLRNVYLVTRDTSTHVQLLNVEEAEEAIPQELGIRLSSLFMYDRLIFVEGPSDEQVLRTFASTLGLNLSRTGVGFVTTGGARNFTHYASAATLAFLAKRRVKLYFILDRDERDALEIQKFQSQLDNLGELKVLDRRELENYLLDPCALARYLRERTGAEVPESKVAQTIADASDQLLATAVERRVLRLACRPIFPDRDSVIDRGDVEFADALSDQLAKVEGRVSELRAQIPNLLQEMRTEVDGYSPEQKLAAIPGDAILESVFVRFGSRFNKRKDGPKIASIMEAKEIPQELVAMLKGFTTLTKW